MKKELESERLLLCLPKYEDIEEFHNTVEMDENVFKYNPGLERIENIDQTKKIFESWFNNDNEIHWIVKLKDNNKIIGMADIEIDDSVIEISCALSSNYWNYGYGTEIVKRIIDYSFNDLNASKVFGRCDINNIGYKRIMEKSGLRFEKETIFKDRNYYILSINKAQ